MNMFKLLVVISFLLSGISARGSKRSGSGSRPSRGSYGSSGKSGSGYSASNSYSKSNSKGGKKGGKRGKGNKSNKGGKDKGGKGNKGDYSIDINQYDLGLEFGEFYYSQNAVAICSINYDSNCIDFKDDYMSFFDGDCDICVPQNYKIQNEVCYNTLEYSLSLDSMYAGMKQIFRWDHQIKDIQVSESSVQNNYGGYGEETEKVYSIKVTVNKEYIKDLCEV